MSTPSAVELTCRPYTKERRTLPRSPWSKAACCCSASPRPRGRAAQPRADLLPTPAPTTNTPHPARTQQQRAAEGGSVVGDIVGWMTSPLFSLSAAAGTAGASAVGCLLLLKRARWGPVVAPSCEHDIKRNPRRSSWNSPVRGFMVYGPLMVIPLWMRLHWVARPRSAETPTSYYCL